MESWTRTSRWCPNIASTQNKVLDVTDDINYDKIIEDTETLQEIIILSLSKAFGSKPKQAAGLVPRDFKFLTVAVVKGKKRESKWIRKWYKLMNDQMDHICEVILNDNPQSIQTQINRFMNIIKVGLYWKDLTTLKLWIHSLNLITNEFANSYHISFIWEWLKKQHLALKAIMQTFLDNNDQARHIWEFLVKIAYNHLDELFMEHILRVWDSDSYKYIETLHSMMNLLQDLAEDSPDIESFFLSGLIQHSWVDYLINQIDSDLADPNSTKQIWLTFLGDIITTFKVPLQKVTASIQAINLAARTAFKHQQITAFTVLFFILKKYALNKNPLALNIYKILWDYAVSYHNDENIRELLLTNLSQVIQENPKIPLDIWLKPLLLQLRRSLDDTYTFNTFDYDFFLMIANHRNLNLEYAIKLWKLWVRLLLYPNPSLTILMSLFQRYLHTKVMVNFITKYLKYLFSVLYEIEKSNSGLLEQDTLVDQLNKSRRSELLIINNTLFPGRGVGCQFDFDTSTTKKKQLKTKLFLHILTQIVAIDNVEINERAVLILRKTMSKLKFKYGIKPSWIDHLKKIIRKGEIPNIMNHNLSLKIMHGGYLTPVALKENLEKLKFTNKTLDQYIIDDIQNDDALETEVGMLSSDGFLKYICDNDDNLNYDNIKNLKDRDAEDKKLYKQRLRIEFAGIFLN